MSLEVGTLFTAKECVFIVEELIKHGVRIKANHCILIAKRELGQTVPEKTIEARAFALMDLPDAKIRLMESG